jgi:hypothetical protein
MAKQNLTQDRLKELFLYDADTGIFYRQTQIRGAKGVGEQAGSNSHGYLLIMIDGKNYSCHRLAWLYMHGEFPDTPLDHINRNRSDNRIINLRQASMKQNSENRGFKSKNKSGYRGVYWVAYRSKWQAKIINNNQTIHLGYFDDAIQASSAYQQKANELFTHFVGGRHE